MDSRCGTRPPSLRCLQLRHGGVGTDGTAVAQRVDGTSLLDAVKMTSSFVVSGGGTSQFFLSGGKTEGGYLYRFSLVSYLGEDVEGTRTKTTVFFLGGYDS